MVYLQTLCHLLLSSLFITYRSYGTCLICVRYRGFIRVKEKFFLLIIEGTFTEFFKDRSPVPDPDPYI